MMEQTLENKLYSMATALWDLQESNYDIQHNYKELLDFDFLDPTIEDKLDATIIRCQEIIRDEKPLADPAVEQIFREQIAPIPNNSVISVVARAIMAGGDHFASKTEGWQVQGDSLCFEVGFQNAGVVKVTIADCPDQSAFVQSLNPFTLDVLVGAMGHLVFEYCKMPISNPLSLKATVTARQFLRYKGFKAHGKKRWAVFEKINQELDKLSKIRIGVKNAQTRNEVQSYQSSLMTVKPLKRDFNPHTKGYIPTSWQIQPGKWATYQMSRQGFEFIGKLNQSVFEYDHREQRGVHVFAKKLMYALFAIPGGTHYVKNGTRKSLGKYLQLIGEHYATSNDPKGNNRHRGLRRLAKALDFLVGEQMIKTSIEGSVSEYIASHSGPWQLRKMLDTIVQIEMVQAPRPALLEENTCPT